MKYVVRYQCGHEGNVELFGPGPRRDYRLRQMRERPCPACLRDVTTDRAQTHAEKNDLPELVGTEKQVGWALTIRYQTLLIIDRLVTPADYAIDAPIPDDLAFFPGERVTLGQAISDLRSEDRAKWWIDNARHVHEIDAHGILSEEDFARDVLRAKSMGITQDVDNLVHAARHNRRMRDAKRQ